MLGFMETLEQALMRQVGYTFQDMSWLRLATTHKSLTHENALPPLQHNERLEFLGDAILDFVVSDLLMRAHPDQPEGVLSKLRSGLVSEVILAQIAREIDLGPCLRMGRGEEASGGRHKESILANALEALVAAVYMDSQAQSGMAEAYRLVEQLFGPRLAAQSHSHTSHDHKTELQELAQKRYKETVTYQVLHQEGPDHEKLYRVGVLLQGRELGQGQGRTKKQAEQDAAKAALDKLRGAG